MNKRNEQEYRDLIILAKLLDNQFTGPYGVKFGVDAIIGIIPGIGDLVSSGMSSYILLRAALLKLPLPILIQMAVNIIIDQVIGVIPILGDLFDIYWKSNQKNVNLVREYIQRDEVVPAYVWLNTSIIIGMIAFILFIPFFLFYQILLLLF